MSEENLAHELRVIPAGGEEPISWPFVPDWVQLWPDAVISGLVEVRARGSIPFPLTGFAPMLLNKPGRTIQLRNTTFAVQSIHVVAGLGIDAPQFVLPTTLAEATAYKVNAELVIDTVSPFNYQHAGGMLLIALPMYYNSNSVPNCTQLLCSGTPMTLFPRYGSNAVAATRTAAQWAYLLAVAAGTVQISPTFTNTTNCKFHCFSITPGAAIGNNGGDGTTTTPITVSITNQYPTSKAYSLATTIPADITEGSGAILMDDGSMGGGIYTLHRRETLGLNSFIYSDLGVNHGIAQVEVFV